MLSQEATSRRWERKPPAPPKLDQVCSTSSSSCRSWSCRNGCCRRRRRRLYCCQIINQGSDPRLLWFCLWYIAIPSSQPASQPASARRQQPIRRRWKSKTVVSISLTSSSSSSSPSTLRTARRLGVVYLCLALLIYLQSSPIAHASPRHHFPLPPPTIHPWRNLRSKLAGSLAVVM